MKVLIVDNNDSFTYNLKHYIDSFSDDVDVVRSNKLQLNDVVNYDKILFSPGPGLPNEYPILNNILSQYGSSKSILGICLGYQSIVEFYGGRLYNLSNPMHGMVSQIKHLKNCDLYKGLSVSFPVGHYHSWASSIKDLPDDLVVTAVNTDGLIMSIRHKKYDIKGVQFHPESILTENGLGLIRNWLIG